MKKLILALLISFIPYFAHADTITSGPIGLIKISTGVVGTRNWGDKYNENFQIIANSMTAVLNATFAPQTPPISIYDNSGNFLGNATTIKFNSNLTTTMSGSTATVNGSAGGGGGPGSTAGSLTIFNGSALTSVSTSAFPGATITFDGQSGSSITFIPAIFSTFTALTSTGVSLSRNWDSALSTWNAFIIFGSTTQGQITALISTITFVGISTQNIQSQIATINSSMTIVRLATSTLDTTLSQRTVVGHDGATPLGGNITDINCAGCTQAGSTLTVPASAAGGSNQFFSSGPLTYRMVVGTQGAIGVDMFVTSVTNFNLMLASFGASGLTSSTTGYGTVFFNNGDYYLNGATVPAGVEIVCGSSVTFIDEFINRTQFTVYGKMRNCGFNMNTANPAARVIETKSSSQLTGFKIYNAPLGNSNGLNGSWATCFLCVTNSSNVVLQGEITDFLANAASQLPGDNPLFMVSGSTYVDIQVNTKRMATSAISSSFFFIAKSANVTYHDSYFADVSGDFMDLGGEGLRDIRIINNTFFQSQNMGDGGMIYFVAGANGSVAGSTGTILIANNVMTVSGNLVGNFIGHTTSIYNGVRIVNNTVSNINRTSGNGLTFASFLIGMKGTVVQNNVANGLTTFISDAGEKTLYVNQGNTLYSVEQ